MCSPSNPTGAVYTADELRNIGQWALANGIWIITDEIYEKLVYEGDMSYLLKVVPELADQTIVVNGVAKSYAMTGWRVGWMYGQVTSLKKQLTSNRISLQTSRMFPSGRYCRINRRSKHTCSNERSF